MKKKFHISDVLSITTGRLLSNSHMSGIYDILNFMVDDNLYTNQLPRASNKCKPFLLKQFPKLGLDNETIAKALTELDRLILVNKGDSTKSCLQKIVDSWIRQLISGKFGQKYDEYYMVNSIPKSAHEPEDPIQEIIEMRNNV